MATVAWLISPYLSMLVICRSRPIARRVAQHTAVTLPVGWIAVLVLSSTLLGLWAPPFAVLAICAALSGLSVMTSRTRGDDDGRQPDDPEDPPPGVDWDAFDAARRRWGRVGPAGGRPRVER